MWVPDAEPDPAAVLQEALLELARPEPRRRMFRRPVAETAGAVDDPEPEADMGPAADDIASRTARVVRRVRSGDPAVGDPDDAVAGLSVEALRGAWERLPRWVTSLVVVAVALLGVGSWALLRRGPEVTTTLPRVATTASRDATGPGQRGATTTVLERSGSGSGPTDGVVVVHVAGAVVRPGVVSLPTGSRATDAVTAAGGLGVGADPDRVNLAAPLVDGERLVIPLVGQPAPVEVAPQLGSSGSGGAGSGGAGSGGAAAAPVDLNTASVEALDALPGIGPTTARAIVAHRDETGPFTSVEQLLDVRGIGDAKLDGLRDLVTVGR